MFVPDGVIAFHVSNRFLELVPVVAKLARELKLEIAADYLVMAAWLAYLKSALLLPRDEQADPSPEELALRLSLPLATLDTDLRRAARKAGVQVFKP